MFKKKIRIWKMYKGTSSQSTALASHPRRELSAHAQKSTLPRKGQSLRKGQIVPRVTAQRTNVQRNLPDPVEYKVPQEMYSAVQAFVSSRLQPRLHYIFAEQGARGLQVQRRNLQSPDSFLEFDAAFLNGIQAISTGKAATCGAFFEKGFRLMKEVVLSDHFSVIIKILKVIFEANMHGSPEIGRMAVQHFFATALALLGPQHPHVRWSRNLLILYDTSGVFQRMMEANSTVMQDVLGTSDNYSLTVRDTALKYSYTSEVSPAPSETIAKFEVLLDDCHKSIFVSDYPFMSVQNSFSHFLKAHGFLARVEEILAKTPELLENNREKPVRRNTLLDSVCLLAEARAAQGKDELAERTFSFAISNAIEIFGAEHDETLGAYQRYADFLATRGREDEVRSLIALMDSKLEPYMLRPESIKYTKGFVYVGDPKSP